MPNTGVSVELTPDGHTVTCPGANVTGHRPTETAAWNACHAQWTPLRPLSVPDGLNGPRRQRKIPTLLVRNLFG